MAEEPRGAAEPRAAVRGVCLLVTDIDAPSGGIQRNSRLLLRELNVRGIATYACVRNYYGLPKAEIVDGTTFRRSPVLGRGLAINGLLYFITTLLWLLMNRRKYDVVHCQQMFGPTMTAAVANYLTGKPILTRVTAIGDLGEVKQIREMPLSSIRLRLIRRVSRWAALTGEMKKELVSLGIPAHRIRVIPNSTEVPAERGYLPEAKALMRDDLHLGKGPIGVFVGRLSEEKNLDLLITAWVEVRRRFPDARLLILGGGGAYRNVEEPLRGLVEELDLIGAVQFLGHLDGSQKYILASDVFILPSRTEGMSNALVEAFACGAAIVATDIPGNTEICRDRENALLVPVGDVPALAAAIIEILGSPDLSARLGSSARQKAEADLSVDRMVTRYLDAYSEMLADPA